MGKVQSYELQKNTIQTVINPLRDQLRDLEEVKKQLFAALIKEMLNVNKKNFKKITNYAQEIETDVVVNFLVDSITKFLCCDDKATFLG